MLPNYCPHCQAAQGDRPFTDAYTIKLCARCKTELGFAAAPPAPRDQPDAPREDIDAPLAPAEDVVAGSGKANTLEETTPAKPAAPADLTRPYTDPSPANDSPATP